MGIIIKEDCDTYLEIYHTKFKILEKTNSMLWNTDEEHTIAVNKERFNNGEYIVSDVPTEPIIDKEIEEPIVEETEPKEENVSQETIEEEQE